MPFGHAAARRAAKSGCPVVDAGIEAEFLGHVAAFVWSTRNADGAGTLDPGDLADNRADRTRSCRDHHGFASDRLADFEQPHVGGHTGHPEDAECGLNWRSPEIDFLQTRAIGQRIALPASTAYDDIALGEAMHIRDNHFANGAALHHLADADGLGVGWSITHPAAHVRIE